MKPLICAAASIGLIRKHDVGFSFRKFKPHLRDADSCRLGALHWLLGKLISSSQR